MKRVYPRVVSLEGRQLVRRSAFFPQKPRVQSALVLSLMTGKRDPKGWTMRTNEAFVLPLAFHQMFSFFHFCFNCLLKTGTTFQAFTVFLCNFSGEDGRRKGAFKIIDFLCIDRLIIRSRWGTHDNWHPSVQPLPTPLPYYASASSNDDNFFQRQFNWCRWRQRSSPFRRVIVANITEIVIGWGAVGKRRAFAVRFGEIGHGCSGDNSCMQNGDGLRRHRSLSVCEGNRTEVVTAILWVDSQQADRDSYRSGVSSRKLPNLLMTLPKKKRQNPLHYSSENHRQSAYKKNNL